MHTNEPFGFFSGDPDLDGVVRGLRDCVRAHAAAGSPSQNIAEDEQGTPSPGPSRRGARRPWRRRTGADPGLSQPPARGCWLGLDVGGTKVALRAETDGGLVREHTFRWRGGGLESDLTQFADEVARFRQQIPDGFTGVGIALPAAVGPDGIVTTWPNRPEWTGLDLRRTLGSWFGDVPVRWADDGDLGALAEARASGCDDVLYVGVGTGIGGGLVAGGVLCPGLDRGSFEIGHVLTDPDGPLCRCGRRGCLQAAASGPAALARAARLRGAPVAYTELCEGLLAAESWAVQAVDHTSRRLAMAITGVCELLHPSLVVVGGGFAAGLPGLVDGVARHVAALARTGVAAPVVRRSELGGLSTLHGAVALARLVGRGSDRLSVAMPGVLSSGGVVSQGSSHGGQGAGVGVAGTA